MNNLIKSWNGKVIRIRDDRYVSLTDMAQATSKNVNDFLRLDKTKSYLETLSGITQIPVMAQNQDFQALIEIRKGGDVSRSGTWGHQKVAIRFAQWCSDDFAIQVDTWIEELLTTGKVEIIKKSTGDMLVEMALAYREQEHRLSQVEQTVARHNAELDRISHPDGHYYTVLGYANILGISINSKEANLLGRKAAVISRDRDIPIYKAGDSKYGHINQYLDSVLSEVFSSH